MSEHILSIDIRLKHEPCFGVVGSRRRTDRESIYQALETIYAAIPTARIGSGGAAGPDTFAEQWMLDHGLGSRMHVFRPKKVAQDATYHRRVQAFYERNFDIASFGTHGLIAFVAPDRKGGTENTIAHARKLRRPIVILLPGDNLVLNICSTSSS